METIIQNGWVIDGTGTEKYRADVLIRDERIVKIGGNIGAQSRHVIDADGCFVMPGFIDTHSHSDIEILSRPALEPKIRQGITTEILGQDGVSVVPVPPKHLNEWKQNIAGLDGDGGNIKWSFHNTQEYLDTLEKSGINSNVAYLAPHGNIRLEVMGWDNRESTDDEIERMKNVLRREMRAGAIGLSTGLIYVPCAYSAKRELIELCKVARELNGIFVVHQRSEANDILDSMVEIIDIARISGVPLHISHFKICGKNNKEKIDSAFEMIDEAKKAGVAVSFDQYPYTAGSTALSVILPSWVMAGGIKNMISNLASKTTRDKIKKEIESNSRGWDNFVEFAGLDGIYITSVHSQNNKAAIGKNLTQLGQMRNTSPLDAAFDLLMEEENNVGMVDFYGDEDTLKKIMCRDEQNFCTDGIFSGEPHPRTYGTYPRVFEKYVKEEKLFSVEQAVYKMCGKPAKTFNLAQRGEIKPGNYADIVIMDFDSIAEKGTYIQPKQYPQGICRVFINGHIVFENNRVDLSRKGMVIRNHI